MTETKEWLAMHKGSIESALESAVAGAAKLQAARPLVHMAEALAIAAHEGSTPAVSGDIGDMPVTLPLSTLLSLLGNVESGQMDTSRAQRVQLEREAAASMVDDDDEVSNAFLRMAGPNGMLCLYELRCTLEASKYLDAVPAEDIDAIIEQFDINRDGFLDHNEFERMVALSWSSEDTTPGAVAMRKWSRDLMDYVEVEKSSGAWLVRVVDEEMSKAPSDQAEPELIVPYGPPGSGKSGATRMVLERLSLTKDDCIDVNIDNMVRSYMREVLKNEELFHDQSTYFAVRKGWPSRAKAMAVERAIATRRHLIKETTGRKLSTADSVIAPAFARQQYRTHIVYPLTPFVYILSRVLARKRESGQGHPPLAELALRCCQSARNVGTFRAAGGHKARVVFMDNTGPLGSARLIESGDPALMELALHVPFQTEVRAMLLREAK